MEREIGFSTMGMVLIIVYAAASMTYVYRWRGNVRYASFSQYLRKSWPILAPLNCLMYMLTHKSARLPVLPADYLQNIQLLRDHWHIIRDEALALDASGAFDAAKADGAAGSYDVGFRTFFKRGWSKFYLTWYGCRHRSARMLCPKTTSIIDQVPGIRGAMFAILPAGAQLSLHSDPMACCFRYHLGLVTPNSLDCHIEVDGVACTWYDGKDFVFDETYPHCAKNATNQRRLILLCDVDRPMTPLGRLVRWAYALFARTTVVPNLPGDTRGLLSAVFSVLSPLRRKSLLLRERQRRLYVVLKALLNGILTAAFLGSLYAALWVLSMALM